jgi:hypothetical protein
MTVLDEPLLREDEAAKELNVRPQTMSAWRYRGTGPSYVRVGKLIFYKPSQIREYIDASVVRPCAQVIAPVVALIIVMHGWF